MNIGEKFSDHFLGGRSISAACVFLLANHKGILGSHVGGPISMTTAVRLWALRGGEVW